MQGPEGPLCRAGLGDARRASPMSGRQVWLSRKLPKQVRNSKVNIFSILNYFDIKNLIQTIYFGTKDSVEVLLKFCDGFCATSLHKIQSKYSLQGKPKYCQIL